MICRASIAKRDGSHRPCLRPDQHDGDCAPLLLVGDVLRPRPRPLPLFSEAELLDLVGVLFVLLLCCLAGCLP